MSASVILRSLQMKMMVTEVKRKVEKEYQKEQIHLFSCSRVSVFFTYVCTVLHGFLRGTWKLVQGIYRNVYHSYVVWHYLDS